ncbi:MAG: ribosome biogenesis GTP-binding protein YihA/YsxC [Clostridiales bacterium]|nr:ribosome biogenesis GTP-binding protein YihA/YsxC [Clostridiales bacterium]
MNIISAGLIISAAGKRQFPSDGLPEAAFAGKSNVGKSSLINALLSRKSLARSSQTPGKTRTINFYGAELSDGATRRRIVLADLPGYGYAKVSKVEREKWGRLAESYLTGRAALRCVALLIDSRHVPGENDAVMADWLRYYAVPTVVVATKADKLSKTARTRSEAAIRAALALRDEPLVMFSSETKEGRDELWSRIIAAVDGGGSRF